MIPQTGETVRQDFVPVASLPSRTFRLYPDTEELHGMTDGLQAVRQAVYLILNTERYAWLIHDWDYGVELQDLIGQDIDYCIPEIERRVREALLQDDRITAVQDFEFTVKKSEVLASFTVVSTFGAFQTEQAVNI